LRNCRNWPFCFWGTVCSWLYETKHSKHLGVRNPHIYLGYHGVWYIRNFILPTTSVMAEIPVPRATVFSDCFILWYRNGNQCFNQNRHLMPFLFYGMGAKYIHMHKSCASIIFHPTQSSINCFSGLSANSIKDII